MVLLYLTIFSLFILNHYTQISSDCKMKESSFKIATIIILSLTDIHD